jgi:hypothetical protein
MKEDGMSQATAHGFHWKAFVSFLVTLTFLVIAVSGLVLYVAPPGRIAHWSGWAVARLSKETWQAVHTVFAFLFLVAAGFHLFLNWRVFLAYLKAKLGTGVSRKRELAAATVVFGAILVPTLAAWPPTQWLVDAGEQAKQSWEDPSRRAPLPHAELLGIEAVAGFVKMPLKDALANLEKAGVAVSDRSATLGEVAKAHGSTPHAVYEKMLGDGAWRAQPKVDLVEGGGWGRKSVADVCGELGITVDEGLARLRAKGISAEPGSNVRELAFAAKMMPIDVARILQGA